MNCCCWVPSEAILKSTSTNAVWPIPDSTQSSRNQYPGYNTFLLKSAVEKHHFSTPWVILCTITTHNWTQIAVLTTTFALASSPLRSPTALDQSSPSQAPVVGDTSIQAPVVGMLHLQPSQPHRHGSKAKAHVKPTLRDNRAGRWRRDPETRGNNERNLKEWEIQGNFFQIWLLRKNYVLLFFR